MDTKNISYEGGYVHYGHKLRDLRKQQNLEIAELAKMVKISQEEIEKLEESRIIDDETLQKMAEALNVSVEAIKSLKEEKAPIVIQNNTFNDDSRFTNNVAEDVNDNTSSYDNESSNNSQPQFADNIANNSPSCLDIAKAYSLMLKMEHEHMHKLEDHIKELEALLKEKENPSPSK